MSLTELANYLKICLFVCLCYIFKECNKYAVHTVWQTVLYKYFLFFLPLRKPVYCGATSWALQVAPLVSTPASPKMSVIHKSACQNWVVLIITRRMRAGPVVPTVCRENNTFQNFPRNKKSINKTINHMEMWQKARVTELCLWTVIAKD